MSGRDESCYQRAVTDTSGSNQAVLAESQAERILFEGRPALLPTLGTLLVTVLTLGLALIYFKLRQSGVFYRITTQRVVTERGIMSKTLEQIDIYRINDYTVERPVGQRIMGTGNIVLVAMDASTPQIRIEGLKTDVLKLYEELRKATETEKRTRGVRVVDYE